MAGKLNKSDQQRLNRHEMLKRFSTLRKNHTIAVLLCVFAGFLGAHRWYVGHKVAAIIIAILGTFFIVANVLGLLQLDNTYLEDWLAILRAYGLFAAIESMLIFRAVEKKNTKLKQELELEYGV